MTDGRFLVIGAAVGPDWSPQLDPFAKKDFRLSHVSMPDGTYTFEQRDGRRTVTRE